jgi:hypothetical protein
VRWASGIPSSESGLNRRSRHRSIFSMVGLVLYDRRLQFRVDWTAQVIEVSQRRLRHSTKSGLATKLLVVPDRYRPGMGRVMSGKEGPSGAESVFRSGSRSG